MATIDIFIGSPIEHASERTTLSRVKDILFAKGISAVILANLNLGGRQLDLVIGLDRGALVVECKGLSSAVKGTENGPWHVRLASGRWKETSNAYVQALGEKMALRDAMAQFVEADVPYPDATVIFVPVIPSGSQVTKGDFKVSVSGLEELPERIDAVNCRSWSLDQWRVFATHHHLTAISSIEAAISPELLNAERLLAVYGKAFLQTYAPLASSMIPASCVSDGVALLSTEVVEQAMTDENILLTGGSGCGKSLLSYSVAVAALNYERVPIIIPAKDFEGKLRDVANREVTLLEVPSAAALILAARLLDRRILLVVDGYNECTPSERQRLTRSVAAIVARNGATAVISSRIGLEREDLMLARNYVVQVPDLVTKQMIAQQAAGGASVEALSDLLGSVGSGLEARMIGQLGQHLSRGISKYGLFDAYVRERLGSSASDGIRALSRIAAMMTERISFALSIRELDRLSDREGISGTMSQSLLTSNILTKRGDRVSFSHEMFLNVFAAEAIIRRAGDDADAVVEVLRLPRHLETRPFVLGAIDDNSFRRRVLSDLSDAKVIRACFAGQCGNDAQNWANMRCDEVLGQINEEIDTIRFEILADSNWGVELKAGTFSNWTEQDRAVLAAIPHELLTGRRIDAVLDLVGRMDERLDEEYLRLLDEKREKKVPLRSALYAASYGAVGRHEIGLNQICGPIQSGHLYGGPEVAACADLYGRLQDATLSPGQVGLLVGLDKYSNRNAPSLGLILPMILNRLWPRAAHHLRLELMHAAGMSARSLSNDERFALIQAIEPLLPTNGGLDLTGIIDALKYLGALDSDEAEHVNLVRAEIEDVLADSENPLMWDRAAGLWNCQFDHPYDGAYCEVWNDLDEDKRKPLLFMAARSVAYDSMFTPALIAEVASFQDPSACPILERWISLPSKTQMMAGEAILSFTMGYSALARLHHPLPDLSFEALSPADAALLACGEILYWLNRDDLRQEERRNNCAGALVTLSHHEAGVAAAVIGEFFRSGDLFSEAAQRLPGAKPVVTSFGQHFPEEVAAIYRSALENPTRQTGYFEFFLVESLMEKALMNLGQLGNASDIPLLRAWSIHPKLGQVAIRAIKAIEEMPH